MKNILKTMQQEMEYWIERGNNGDVEAEKYYTGIAYICEKICNVNVDIQINNKKGGKRNLLITSK